MKHKLRDISVQLLTGDLAIASVMFAAAMDRANKDAKGVPRSGR
jgi:hypothetical protein